MSDQIKPLLDRLASHIAAYRKHGESGAGDFQLAITGGRVAGAAEELLNALQIRAYTPTEHTDDRLEQVVITVHGVDLSIRGRTDDLFVHIDPDERDEDDARRFPLVVEVNNCGEQVYGS